VIKTIRANQKGNERHVAGILLKVWGKKNSVQTAVVNSTSLYKQRTMA
jgi:hypothetical protein